MFAYGWFITSISVALYSLTQRNGFGGVCAKWRGARAYCKFSVMGIDDLSAGLSCADGTSHFLPNQRKNNSVVVVRFMPAGLCNPVSSCDCEHSLIDLAQLNFA